MRLCHFSDSHLGAGAAYPRRAESGLTLRQEDIINSFVEAVDRIIALNPDLCIHSGDLFHQVRPLNSIMATAGREFYRLAAEAGIPTVLIAGNHDAPRQPHVGAAIDVFRQIPNLYVIATSTREQLDIGPVSITAVPHCLTSTILQDQLAACSPSPEATYNVLVLHGVVAGMPEFSMADLGEQEVPQELLSRFDYTALGHYHNYRQVAPRAFYAGSTERLSLAERDDPKGFIEVTLDPFGVVFHEVASRPMLDMPALDATGKRGDELARELEAVIDEIGPENKIIRVTVSGITDETLKTLPVETIEKLKHRAFQLDIRMEKAERDTERGFGRSAIGALDSRLSEYFATLELEGFDRELLRDEALRYLRQVDQG